MQAKFLMYKQSGKVLGWSSHLATQELCITSGPYLAIDQRQTVLGFGPISPIGDGFDHEQPVPIQVWVAPRSSQSILLESTNILANEDKQAAERFRQLAHRQRYLCGRVLLRLALSQSFGGEIHPSQWRFSRDVHGRPKIEEGFPFISFSLSHTAAGSVVAISEAAEVGLDVVTLDQNVPFLDTKILSPLEHAALLPLPSRSRARFFLTLWSLKEAYAKLRGTGLLDDLSMIQFSFDPSRSAVSPQFAVPVETWTMAIEDRPCQISLAFRTAHRNQRHPSLRVVNIAANDAAERLH